MRQLQQALKTLVLLSFVMPFQAAAQSMSLPEVVQEVLSKHPDVAISELSEKISQTNRDSLEGMLDPNYVISAGIADEKTPTTSPFAASGTNIAQIQGRITQPLSDGSMLTGQWSYVRNRLSYPPTTPLAFQPTVNPTYSNQLDLIYRYPLLRGRNKPDYHGQVAALQAEKEAAVWQTAQKKEALVNQSVNAFFQVALDEINAKIMLHTVQRAKKLLAYQKKRKNFGLIEDADLLQTKALLSSSRFNLTQARTTLKNDKVFLNRLMLRDANSPLKMHIPKQASALLKGASISSLMEQAEKNRAIFGLLEARLAANEARLAVANDQEYMKLDITGQVGTRALEAGRGQAFSNGFRVKDRYIGVNIELSDTIGGHKADANIRRAILNVEDIKLRKVQARENVRTEIATTFNAWKNMAANLKAAKHQAYAQKKKFDAELKRYKEGRADMATLLQFEGDLNAATLQAALQEIQMQLTAVKVLIAAGITPSSTAKNGTERQGKTP